MFNIDEIDYSELEGLNESGLKMIKAAKIKLDENEEVTDEMLAFYVSKMGGISTERGRRLDVVAFAQSSPGERPNDTGIIKRVKKEFYDLFCTESEKYKQIRLKANENINVIIAGVAATIASLIGGVHIGIITSIVVVLLMTVSKVGQQVACETFKLE